MDKIEPLLQRLEDETNRYAQDQDNYAEAKHAYELAYHKGVLSAEGPNAEVRKAKAFLGARSEHRVLGIRDASVRATKEKLETLRATLVAEQTRLKFYGTADGGVRSPARQV